MARALWLCNAPSSPQACSCPRESVAVSTAPSASRRRAYKHSTERTKWKEPAVPAVRRDAEQSDRDGRATLSLQRFQFDVLEPARAAVILQTDVAALRVIFVGDVELVRAAVRALVRFCELAEVCGC